MREDPWRARPDDELLRFLGADGASCCAPGGGGAPPWQRTRRKRMMELEYETSLEEKRLKAALAQGVGRPGESPTNHPVTRRARKHLLSGE